VQSLATGMANGVRFPSDGRHFCFAT